MPHGRRQHHPVSCLPAPPRRPPPQPPQLLPRFGAPAPQLWARGCGAMLCVHTQARRNAAARRPGPERCGQRAGPLRHHLRRQGRHAWVGRRRRTACSTLSLLWGVRQPASLAAARTASPGRRRGIGHLLPPAPARRFGTNCAPRVSPAAACPTLLYSALPPSLPQFAVRPLCVPTLAVCRPALALCRCFSARRDSACLPTGVPVCRCRASARLGRGFLTKTSRCYRLPI